MARRLFGSRTRGHSAGTADWPQLPGVFGSIEGAAGPLPPPPTVPVHDEAVTTPAAPATELLERIAAFRGAISDALYEISKDYQMLCNLTHAELAACDEVVAELRRRLAGDIHYDVLAKLDEALALVAGRIGAARPSPPPAAGASDYGLAR